MFPFLGQHTHAVSFPCSRVGVTNNFPRPCKSEVSPCSFSCRVSKLCQHICQRTHSRFLVSASYRRVSEINGGHSQLPTATTSIVVFLLETDYCCFRFCRQLSAAFNKEYKNSPDRLSCSAYAEVLEYLRRPCGNFPSDLQHFSNSYIAVKVRGYTASFQRPLQTLESQGDLLAALGGAAFKGRSGELRSHLPKTLDLPMLER